MSGRQIAICVLGVFLFTYAAPAQATAQGISFVGAGGFSFAGQPTSLPSFYDVDDILVVVAAGNAVTPAGWTRQAPGVYWKRAGSDEGAPYFGPGVATWMAAYRGCETTGNPFEATGVTTQGTVNPQDAWYYIPGAQSITTISEGAFVLLAVGLEVEDLDCSEISISDPASGPARTRAFAWGGGNGYSAHGIGLWHDVKSAAGPTGVSPGDHVAAYAVAGAATFNSTLLALRPAP